MTKELKSKFSKPLCLFWLPIIVWRNTVSEQHVRLAVLKINAKKHLEAMIKDRDDWKAQCQEITKDRDT